MYNAQMIIPGPLIDIQKRIRRSEAGQMLGQYFSIQAKGKLMAWKGSPTSSGSFWTGSYLPGPNDENIPSTSRLAAMRSKMQALDNLFCAKGLWFEIQPFDGSQAIKFQPRVADVHFPQGIWYETMDYTIDMEADTVYFGGTEMCGDVNDTSIVPEESWAIEAADQIGRTYRLTHTVSSQQKDLYDSVGHIPVGNNGWERAQTIVLPYLGIQDASNIIASGVLNLNHWQAYNYFRAQHKDQSAGKFAVTETWLVYDSVDGTIPPALDDFTIDSKVGEDGISHVNIQGTVTGLEIRDVVNGALSQTRWTSAVAYFNTYVYPNIFGRALSYTGLVLNPTQLMSSIGRNPVQGTVAWSVEYSNRALPLITNAIHEDLQLSYEGATNVFASIPIPGRVWGPLLQDMGTITQQSVSINLSAQMPAATILSPSVTIANPNTDGIILALAPVALQVFRQRDNTSWSPENGRYSRQVTFVYQ